MKPRWVIWMVMNLALLPSCGAPDKAADQKTPAQAAPGQVKDLQKEADRIVEQQMANLQTKEASTFPCSLFPQQEIERLAGNPLDKGSYTFNNITVDDHSYKSESCDWSAKGGQGNEVVLSVSLPKHFKSGAVECEQDHANKKISGPGDQSRWEYVKSFGMGTLRVCSAKAMLEVKVTVTSKEEALAKRLAQSVSDKVLASQ